MTRSNNWSIAPRERIIPTAQELATLITDLSNRHYHGGYLPSASFFDMQRPVDWPPAAGLCKLHGLPQSAQGWASLMVLLGLNLPVATRSANAQRSLRERYAAQEPPTPGIALSGPTEQTASRYGEGDGLPVQAIWSPVRAWCVKRHCYVVVGHRQTYEVR